MRSLNSREYQDASQRVERMADGISRHKDEDKFPGTLDEAELRKLREELESARSDYEEKTMAANLAYDKYTEVLKRTTTQLSRADDTVRGYYGKDNPIVAEFGTAVVTKTKARKPKAPAGAKG